MKYKLYEVGGKIRDELMGLTSKDVDYTVVIENIEEYTDPFDSFKTLLEEQGFDIFLVTKECATIRAMFPKDHKYSGVADFVIARKETEYVQGTRIPVIEYGNLRDDLIRRDFTVNALAKGEDGVIIDLFDGIKDLNLKILRTPTDAHITFTDDPLRILRAFRFSVTKGLVFSDQVVSGIKQYKGDFSTVSTERVSDELNKMFSYNTYLTLWSLNYLQSLNMPVFRALIKKGWKLQMTNKK